MKWVLAGAFLFVMCLTIVVQATRPAEEATGMVKLIWATDDNPAREEQLQLFRERHPKQYGEKIDIAIDPSNISMEKVIIQSLAGVGPDVFDYFSQSNLERYVESGIILDVTGEAKEHNFGPERVWPGMRPSFVYNGRQYGFPDNACNYLLLYHKDVFDRRGVPYPPADWTWRDFLKIARKLTYQDEKGLRHFAVMGANGYDAMVSNGARLFSPHGTRCTLDSPQALEALQFCAELRTEHHVAPTPAEMASQSAAGGWGGGDINVFATKCFAMTQAGRYWIIQYAKDARALLAQGKPAPFHLGVAQMPRFGTYHCTGGARCTGVNRNSKRVRYALRFLEYLASEPFNRQINRSFDALAPVMEFCKGPTGIADGPPPPPGLDAANDPVWARAMEYTSELQRSPFIPPYRVQFLMGDVFGKQDVGEITPAEALRTFTRLVNEEIQRNVRKNARLQELYERCRKLDAKGYGSMGVWEYGGRCSRSPTLPHSHTPILPHSQEARR